MSKHLASVGRKTSLLTGRHRQQNCAQGGTAICWGLGEGLGTKDTLWNTAKTKGDIAPAGQ